MKNAVKGALFSGLVFPGAGQMILKRYARGIALMLAVIVCLAFIIMKATQQAVAILKKLETTGGMIDMNAISRAAVETSTASGSRSMNLCLILIVVCWILGTLDAYWIGYQLDRQGRVPPDIPPSKGKRA